MSLLVEDYMSLYLTNKNMLSGLYYATNITISFVAKQQITCPSQINIKLNQLIIGTFGFLNNVQIMNNINLK